MKSIAKQRYQAAQESEKECWGDIKEKVVSEEYLGGKARFWRDVIEELPSDLKMEEHTRILDAGWVHREFC